MTSTYLVFVHAAAQRYSAMCGGIRSYEYSREFLFADLLSEGGAIPGSAISWFDSAQTVKCLCSKPFRDAVKAASDGTFSVCLYICVNAFRPAARVMTWSVAHGRPFFFRRVRVLCGAYWNFTVRLRR